MKKILTALFLLIITFAVIFSFKSADSPAKEKKEGGIIFSVESEAFVFFEENASALELLAKTKIPFETKDFSFGVLVESIKGKKNGEEGRYWSYYVNGEMPMVSADKYIVNKGDKVEFRYE
ncbi:MAG: hypothetical protein A2365_00685 [Candidatus Nealsonbacteria bacterium RIFOXYB1_FULL_40_15]|uniref:Transcobalamin-like C-terminal domain-containing protein n=2 Tax=Candidatus Nealsoniibacteriota TaxID=1817911 RepID=A0A1G2ESJ5_9BACT|nr:MAG: hypothetical protein A2365_00685 [Candidatus Nealsonbacteria bacterium RIFOXYB1_FULL_40_15]OGZ28785.1 MAG: hypothetical protein A2427_01865 [Candidatus Nealsonbacteria bacterium RIFOXYC1_FULL_40_7]OGZ29063.1 MAG: hypothetical protein A2562_01120 [Candidatus Nealsonbacteria bacterium RIFOXYD1_FULL_39_11]